MKIQINSIIKLLEIYVLRILIHVLHIFPIKENRIIITSYRGTQYACNPKYITETILKTVPGKYELIWAFQKPEKFKYLKDKGIKLVKFNSIKRFYYEATAKVSINNVGSFSWIPLRKGQEHVNTWHSGLDLTGCALTEPRNDVIMKKTLKMSTRETTLFLASNKLFTHYSMKRQFQYTGKVLKYGLPRSDDFLNGNRPAIEKKMRNKLGINENTVVIMYAPTWRYAGIKAMPLISLSEISKAMHDRFGNNYLVMKRAHHLTGKNQIENEKHIIDVSDYPNIQELITVCNIVISDYSSLIWDSALAGAYIILYTPDVKEYSIERGMYTSIYKWGFPVALNQEELNSEISKIDLDKGKEMADKHLKKFGSYETGEASNKFCEWLAKL